MSEKLRESLSAAMDDEADAFELRRVIDEARANPEMRDLWHRQHLVRDVLQGGGAAHQDQLRTRLHQQMEELRDAEDATEDTPTINLAETEPTVRRKPNWAGRLAGSAVAAIAALLVVLNADLFVSESGVKGTSLLATTGDPQAAFENAEIAVPVMYESATDADRMRMDALRMHHYQQNALNRPGAVSFVRMAAFGRTRSPEAHSDNNAAAANLQISE